MTTLISAVVVDPVGKRKKSKGGKSSKTIVELRGGIEQLETGLLGETSDPLTKEPPAVSENQSEQSPEPARTAKPDSVAYNADRYAQSNRPCFGGIGSDDTDIELKQHQIIDTSRAGSAEGGYSKSGGDGAGGDYSNHSSPTSGRAGSNDSGHSVELKRKASKLGGLLKGKLKSAGASIGELVEKAKDKANTVSFPSSSDASSKGQYELHNSEDDKLSSNSGGGGITGSSSGSLASSEILQKPSSSWLEL